MVHMRQAMGTLLLLLVALAIPLSSVLAQSDAAFITYRQKVMASLSANMAATATILKDKLPYQDNIVHHAYQIQSASRLIPSAFRHQVTAGKTDAKPDIWKDWQKFVAAAEKLGEESGKLAEVAKSGDMAAIAAQRKAVGKSCGGCHKSFRKPKEESYKRMK